MYESLPNVRFNLSFDLFWAKKNSVNTFDVTMGSFDGAKICELVGLYILNTLEKRFGSNVGLYRDDGLAAINNIRKTG